MPRIERDPHLETPPDFASAHYDMLRTLLVNAGATEEDALTQITNAWQQENEARRAAWDHQVEEDQLAQEETDRLAREQEQDEQEAARREREKKKSKMNDFDTNRSVGGFITPRPSTFATNKLENFDYIELFYFTREGCLDAMSSQRTEADDTFGLSKMGDLVSLRSISALRASKKCHPGCRPHLEPAHLRQDELPPTLGKGWMAPKTCRCLSSFLHRSRIEPFPRKNSWREDSHHLPGKGPSALA